MKKPKIRVLIADDHHLVRAGIVALLREDPQIEIVGDAADGKEAVSKAKTLMPNIALVDIAMPIMNGIEATQAITRTCPDVKVLVLSQHESEEYVQRMVEAGAKGYLLKNSLAQDLLTAVHVVNDGEQFFVSPVSELMISSYLRKTTDAKSGPSLTKREKEILKLVADGLTSQQIADRLYIGLRTVQYHRTNIHAKLQIRDTAGLVKYALQHKLIDLE
jgi:NarL family two-component system response regulator LiaR